MCGFFSIHNKDRHLDNIDQSIKLIKNNLKNRGPDSQNSIILNDNLQPIKEVNKTKNLIIASRLNIIDDDRKSNLPFISDCKKFILSFNGEIYNFKELKKKYLNNIEHKTNSDTEVLLNLLKYKGEYILNELNGIFALSFYNLNKKKLLLARDRLGVKPLYYYFKNNTFSYSSDVKNILIFKDVRKKINKNLSALFLSNISSIKNNETFFDGIEKLQGANFLTFDLKNFVIEKYKNYWFVPKNVDPKVYTSMELYNDLHSTIERQSINNRDIAITLSGGLDSSILGLLLRNIYPEKRINAYSFTFSQNQNINEKQYSDLVSKKFNLKKNEIKIDMEKILSSIKETNYALSFPAYGLSNVAQNLVYKKINDDGIRVCYDGQGADEVFGGYHGYGSALMHSNLKELKLSKFILNFYHSLLNKNIKTRFYLNFLSRFLSPKLYKFFLNFTEKSEIKSTLRYDKENFDKYFYSFLNDREVIDKNNLKNEILYFLTKGIESLLNSLDSNSMNLGVEARVPFLDNLILDKYLLMNNDQRISSSLIFKKLLKDAFINKLPEQVLKRKDKVGFSTDDDLLLKTKIDEIISDVNNLEPNSVIDKKNFLKILNKYRNNKLNRASNIFKMYSYSLWCNQFKVYE